MIEESTVEEPIVKVIELDRIVPTTTQPRAVLDMAQWPCVKSRDTPVEMR